MLLTTATNYICHALGHLPLLARLSGTLCPRTWSGCFWGQLQAVTEDVFIFAVLMCSAH